MGKKTKKTTWRNLQIEDHQPSNSSITTISDSEESHITVNSFHSTNHYQRTRYHQGSGGSGGRWGSAPPHHQRHSSDERPARYNQQQKSWPNGGGGGSGGTHQSTRLDRSCIGDGRYWATSYKGGGGGGKDTGTGAHQTKITFNEDEYTRITTPRQDVLFKKGYLNRPKPSLVTSSLASTTDGSGNMDLVTTESNSLLPTPDHVLLTPDSPFYYPTTGYIARDGLYFFNGFEPYPVLVYNAAPPQYCYSAAEFPLSSRSKRYSTDSMTESTSPHTEEFSGVDGEAALFLPPTLNATAVQSTNSTTNVRRTQQLNNTNSQEANAEESAVTNGINEQRKLKKKRRRKVSKPLTTNVGESTTTSVSVSSCEDDQQDTYSSSSDTEEINAQENNTAAEKQEDSTSTCPNSPQSGSSSLSSMTTHSSLSATEEQSSKASSQLKPDAKEFIPRHFAALDFVQQSQPQFHVIDQHGFIQTAFLPLPILLSPVGPPQQFLLPPPAYNTINHLPRAEINEGAGAPEDVKLTTVEEVPKDMHIGKAVQLNDASKVVSLEDNAKALSILPVESSQAIVQSSLSKSDIREIVSKLEEAAKEQEKSVKNHPRDSKNTTNRFNNNNSKRESPYRQKGRFSSAEASPIQSKNAYKNSVSLSKKAAICKMLPQNVKAASVEHQRKPYSNLFKQPQVFQNRATKPTQQVNPSLKCKTLVVGSVASMSSISNPSPVSNKHVPSTVACSNQWINVSNRKKRRANNINCTAEDQQLEDLDIDLVKDKPTMELLDLKQELVVQQEVQLNSSQMDDGFEKYDIDKLVDVVVEDMKLEKCLESENITELNIAPDEEVEIVVQEIKSVEVAAANESFINEKELKDKHQNQKKKPNSKNIKQIKRVMVTDNITPVVVKEIKETPIKKMLETVVKKNEEKTEIVSHKKEVSVVSSENTPSKSSKKSNKKKANSKLGTNNPTAKNIENKADVSREGSSSSTSYNFLPTNSENKTNIEVSQELDMLIQRGMYSSLEEKIRSFNITASNDGFFKTINYYGPGKLMNTENSFGNKDFNGILKDLKPTMSSNFEIGIPTNISQNLTNNSNNGYQDFLGLGPDLHEPDKRLRTESRETSPLDVACEVEEEPYPITRAVKEWMFKTREHTPDIELLKSPRTILKQFAKPAEASLDLDDNEDEVTLWTLSNQDSIETDQDLLDCWETEESASCPDGIKSIDKEDVFVGQVVFKAPNGARAVSRGNQREPKDEDALEAYESKYGKNEDFLRIREEWEERGKIAAASKNSCDSRKRRNVLPPAASLPYRAICCAIM